MAFKETKLYEMLTYGFSAVAVILALKLIFLGPLKIPGLSNAVAAI